MQILNFGSCNIDLVYALDHITAPGETNAATTLSYFPGGKGLNQSIALARAGAQVFHAGCIGEDGGMLVNTMKNANVDLRYLKTVPEKTGHAVIQVDKKGENCIIIYAGANGEVSKDHIDAVLENFTAEDFLLVQNEISNLTYLITAAYQKGMRVVFNPSPYQDSLKEIDLNQISYLILNEGEADGMFRNHQITNIQNSICENYPQLIVILTLGKAGSVYISNDTIFKQPAYSVKNVDTTAAGDTFTGYFIALLASGKQPQESLRIASAAAALAVSREGASSSIPHKTEVLESLPHMIPYVDTTSDNVKERVYHYFDEHYKDGTLKDLADTLGYSQSYTASWLKSNLGENFSICLQKKKCEICAHLLESTNLPVGEIIHKVGYKNESHFRKLFLAYYSETPLKYRQRMCKSC